MANKPATFDQALNKAASQAASTQAQQIVAQYVDIPDPIAGPLFKLAMQGQVSTTDVLKSGVNYALGMIGVPIAAVTGVLAIGALGYALGQKLVQPFADAFKQAFQLLGNYRQANLQAQSAMEMMENDITAFEFVQWVYDQLEPVARDANIRQGEWEMLKLSARSTRPPNADTMLKAALGE